MSIICYLCGKPTDFRMAPVDLGMDEIVNCQICCMREYQMPHKTIILSLHGLTEGAKRKLIEYIKCRPKDEIPNLTRDKIEEVTGIDLGHDLYDKTRTKKFVIMGENDKN